MPSESDSARLPLVPEAANDMDTVLDQLAGGLYSLASMLCGEGEETVRVVEVALANAEVSACSNFKEARCSSRRALCSGALELLARRGEQLAPPAGLDEAPKPCIDDDDLEAAGISADELEAMFSGSDRERVRSWLESLPLTHRIVFSLRAVAGIPSRQAAGFLRHHAGPTAQGWTANLVREVFRQALCSLTSQLIHRAAHK